jgi:hypothetical protein
MPRQVNFACLLASALAIAVLTVSCNRGAKADDDDAKPASKG